MGKYIRGRGKIEEVRQRLDESLEAENQLEAAAEVVKDKPDELLIALEKEAAEITNKLQIITRVKQIESSLRKRQKVIQPFIKKLKDLRAEDILETPPAQVEESTPTTDKQIDTIKVEKPVKGVEHLEDF